MEYSFSQTFGKHNVVQPISECVYMPSTHDSNKGQILCKNMFNSGASDNYQSKNSQIHRKILKNKQNLQENKSLRTRQASQKYIKHNFKQNSHINNQNQHQLTTSDAKTPKFIKSTYSFGQLPSQQLTKPVKQQDNDLQLKVKRLLEELRKQNGDKSRYSNYRSKTQGKCIKSAYYHNQPIENNKSQSNRIIKTSSHSVLPRNKTPQKASFSKLAKSYGITTNKKFKYPAQIYDKIDKYDSRSFLDSIRQNDSKFSILHGLETVNTSLSTVKSKPKFFEKDYTNTHCNYQNLLNEKKQKTKIRTIQSQFSDEPSSTSKKIDISGQSVAEFKHQVRNQPQAHYNEELEQNENSMNFSIKIQKISKKIDDYQKRINGNFFFKENIPKSIPKHEENIWVQQKIDKNTLYYQQEQKQQEKYLESFQEYQIYEEKPSKKTKNIIQEQFSLINQKAQLIRTPYQKRQEIRAIKPAKKTLPKIAIEINKQISLDQEFRKAKKQFSKIPDGYLFPVNRINLSKWQLLKEKLNRSLIQYGLHELHQEIFGKQSSNRSFNQVLEMEELFEMKDDEADPFYSITLGNQARELEDILDNIVQMYIISEKNYRKNIQRNFSQEEFQDLLNLMKNSTIALDQFIIAVNQLTKSNYKCRDGYLLYCRLKGKDSVLSRVHLQGKMIEQNTY